MTKCFREAKPPPTRGKVSARTAMTLVTLALTQLVACGEDDVPLLRLERSTTSFPARFGRIDDFRELSDRVSVLIEGVDRTVVLIDWETGSSRVLGRAGDGPNEHRGPRRLFPYIDGSVLVLDQMGRLFTASMFGEFRALRRPDAVKASISGVRGADSIGRVYFEYERSLYRDRSGRERWTDSLVIARWDLRDGRVDTIGLVAPEPHSSPVSRNGVTLAIPKLVPLRTRDQWSVSGSGVVAIAHTHPYRVEFIAPSGQRAVGQSIKYDPVVVTEAMRQEWRDAVGTIPVRISVVPWPKYVPPFLDGALQFSADGRLWIERTRIPGKPQLYDVFESGAGLVARARFPAGTRVVGVGVGRVYVSSMDAAGFIQLGRYVAGQPTAELGTR